MFSYLNTRFCRVGDWRLERKRKICIHTYRFIHNPTYMSPREMCLSFASLLYKTSGFLNRDILFIWGILSFQLNKGMHEQSCGLRIYSINCLMLLMRCWGKRGSICLDDISLEGKAQQLVKLAVTDTDPQCFSLFFLMLTSPLSI